MQFKESSLEYVKDRAVFIKFVYFTYADVYHVIPSEEVDDFELIVKTYVSSDGDAALLEWCLINV